MSGLKWLGGKSWSEVTRDERFFCAVLYESARRDPAGFAHWLIEVTSLNINPAGFWDVGYEVCFYRDFLHFMNRSARQEAFPIKRTFDLCLFGDSSIIIIEAKVCEAFGAKQNEDFKKDSELIAKLPGLGNVGVFTVALASSKYFSNAKKYGLTETLDFFDGKISWAQVAEKYDDPRLKRTDSMYKLKPGQFFEK